jgi:hypothetical protein
VALKFGTNLAKADVALIVNPWLKPRANLIEVSFIAGRRREKEQYI